MKKQDFRIGSAAWRRFVLLAAGVLGMGGAVETAEERISFNRDIRPILSDKCFHCHGPDEATREARLRLDVREDAVERGALIPGDLKASEVHWRVHAEDEDERMPPADLHKSLTDAEKATLDRWIEEGAEYEEHWAYLPVRRPAAESEGSEAVDVLVDGVLQREGLERSPRADEITLLRRLHFDLIGLPPGPEDLAAYRQDGLEATVDRLLASPHFGERMAMEWLDAVRYADSHGYHGDQFVEVSAFRDWVIAAFNANTPFDVFTIEQIAGDLLSNATLEQQVAASYNRLGQSSSEGGIQDAEYLAKYQAERVRTTSTAWMGSTLACAECHDHKFDPYTAKDFYRFAAFFADILEKGAWTGDGSYQEDTAPYERDGIAFSNRGPLLAVPEEEELSRLDALEKELAAQEKQYRETTPELLAGAVRWAEEQRRAAAESATFDYAVVEDRGESRGIDTKGWRFVAAKEGPVFAGEVSRKQEAAGVVQHIGKFTEGSFVLSEGDQFFAYLWLDPENPPRQIMLQFHHGERGWAHRAWWGEDEIPYGKGSTGPAHHRVGDLPLAGEWVRLEVDAAAIGLAPGEEVTQFAFTQFSGLAYWDTSGVRTASDDYRWKGFSKELREVLARPETRPDQPFSEAEKALLVEHYRGTAPELEPLRGAIDRIRGEADRIRSGMRTVPATISATPREIRVLPRGDWTNRDGEVVLPGTPHFLPGAVKGDSGGDRPTRLDLARWLVTPENPLTARTWVNRLWARFFGRGISEVLDDLGSQGSWPTHPLLLDWLAAEFMESGWDMKHLVKTIVMSETYAQASDRSPALDELDPYNRLLARQSAIRLPAELIRDNALAVSGLLNPAMGGRSARPYQPEGYYQHLNFPRRSYEADTNENQYRRGVYTHWQRSFLHPAMKAFDAPAREECTMDRDSSTTPLQALVLLNDPSFVEAAKMLAAAKGDMAELFARVLTRQASAEELAVLDSLREVEKKRLQEDPALADEILQVGLAEVPTGNPVDLAARVAVTRALLNLHEVITRY